MLCMSCAELIHRRYELSYYYAVSYNYADFKKRETDVELVTKPAEMGPAVTET